MVVGQACHYDGALIGAQKDCLRWFSAGLSSQIEPSHKGELCGGFILPASWCCTLLVSSEPGAPYHLWGMVGASVRHYDTRHTERVSASFGSGCRQIMPSLWGRVAALFCPHLGAGFGGAPSLSRTTTHQRALARTRRSSSFRSPLRLAHSHLSGCFSKPRYPRPQAVVDYNLLGLAEATISKSALIGVRQV